MDGTVLDVPDTPSNLKAFGRHHSGRGDAALMASAEYSFNQRGYGTHQAMAELVEMGATVLDVGCASGYLMETLQRAKNCHCVGIEPNPVAASRASALGFDVITSTAIDAFAARRKSGDQFKHIIFGDVLEHMTEPDQVLEQCRSLLRPNGTIIVSLPNIVYLRARVRIALGIWRYEKIGIFDRTHLRFFTIRTGRELLAEAGYAIFDERFVGPLTYLGGGRLQSVTKLRPQVLASQMIFVGRPILSNAKRTS